MATVYNPVDIPYPFDPSSFSEEALQVFSEEVIVTAAGAPISPPLFFDTGAMTAIATPGNSWHIIDLPTWIPALPAEPVRMCSGLLYVHSGNATLRPWQVFLRPYGVTTFFRPVVGSVMGLVGQDLWFPVNFSTGTDGKIEINVNDDGSGGFAAMTSIVVRIIIDWHTRVEA